MLCEAVKGKILLDTVQKRGTAPMFVVPVSHLPCSAAFHKLCQVCMYLEYELVIEITHTC